MTGTLINVGTVLVGGTVGWAVGNRIPASLRQTLIQAVGLITLVIGFQGALATTNILLLLGALALGGLIGELLRLEHRLESLGEALNRLAQRLSPLPFEGDEGEGVAQPHQRVKPDEFAPHPKPAPVGGESAVARGFVTASLIFCVGPMTILGSFEDGLRGAYQTLALKATMDGVTAALLASTLGWGVLLSAGTILFYQGFLTLGAGLLRDTLSDAMIVEMTAVGGVIIVAIGLNILEVARIRAANLLPAIMIGPVLAGVVGQT